VATIPGRGYRFTAHVDAVTAPAARADSALNAGSAIDLTIPGKPSIAVLPFTNLSGDPEQEYFTDGVVEDIITELSRFRSLFVTARNSSFTYKGKAVDVRAVSQQLGVRYVLEGSIRRVGERIRVTTQLIDATTGTSIWSERYDRVLEDIFVVQEELTRSIVAAIAPQITAAEYSKAARRRPEKLSVYELGMRVRAEALAAYLRNDRELREQVIRQARETLKVDDRNVDAYVAIAHAYLQHAVLGSTPDIDEAYREGLEAANRAIQLDPSDHSPYIWKGYFLTMRPMGEEDLQRERHQFDEGLRAFQRAHELNPNDPLALQGLSMAEAALGDTEHAIEHATQALRVNPRDPWLANGQAQLAFAYLAARDYAKALEWALLASKETPNLPLMQAYLVYAYVGLGDIQAARRAFEKLRELMSAELLASRLKGDSASPSPELRRRLTTFLRIAAGLEEPSAADALR
jgi:TolB-like protein